MSRTVSPESKKKNNNSVYVLFFSQTVGVRSQKTRWLYAARRGDFRGIFQYFVAIFRSIKKKRGSAGVYDPSCPYIGKISATNRWRKERVDKREVLLVLGSFTARR